MRLSHYWNENADRILGEILKTLVTTITAINVKRERRSASIKFIVNHVNNIAQSPLSVRMRRNRHKTISGVKFDFRFEIYVPDFLYDEKFWKLDHDLFYIKIGLLTHNYSGKMTIRETSVKPLQGIACTLKAQGKVDPFPRRSTDGLPAALYSSAENL